jgi:CubicO group peptidase (beta-lactamase class C family)
MQPDAILRLYSMTKLITSVAALMLYEDGRFLLDDPVSCYIPEFAGQKVCREATAQGLQLVEPEQAMTIRHLMTHTAGFPFGPPDNSPLRVMYDKCELTRPDRSLHEMVQLLGELPLMYHPGTIWGYGLATDVLAYLVEVLSGKPFDAFLEARIFMPLAMTETGFYVPPEQHERVAAVYGPAAGGGLARLETLDTNRFLQPGRFLSGGGGLVSTAADYLRFAQMLLNGGELDGTRLLSRKTVELMTRNHLPASLQPSFRFPGTQAVHYLRGHGFGLGVRVLTDMAQAGVLGSEGEFGWSGVANTCVWIDPKEEMICLFLPQFMPLWYYPVDRQFKVLAYQAITG